MTWRKTKPILDNFIRNVSRVAVRNAVFLIFQEENFRSSFRENFPKSTQLSGPSGLLVRTHAHRKGYWEEILFGLKGSQIYGEIPSQNLTLNTI